LVVWPHIDGENISRAQMASSAAGVAGVLWLVRLKASLGASAALPFRSTFTMVMPRPQQC